MQQPLIDKRSQLDKLRPHLSALHCPLSAACCPYTSGANRQSLGGCTTPPSIGCLLSPHVQGSAPAVNIVIFYAASKWGGIAYIAFPPLSGAWTSHQATCWYCTANEQEQSWRWVVNVAWSVLVSVMCLLYRYSLQPRCDLTHQGPQRGSVYMLRCPCVRPNASRLSICIYWNIRQYCLCNFFNQKADDIFLHDAPPVEKKCV